MSYTWHERIDYRPACPTCGRPVGEVDWAETTAYGDREERYTPGWSYCYTTNCPGGGTVRPRGLTDPAKQVPSRAGK